MLAQAQRLAVGPRDHVVQFYADDAELVRTAGGYLLAALQAGDVAIVIATPAHLARFDVLFAAAGVDLAAARATGSLVTLDAAETLRSLLADGSPDPGRFDAVVGTLVRTAASHGRAVRAYGELVALLWDDGRVAGAIELEALWNDLGERTPFSLFCAYPASVEAGGEAAAVCEVCRLHTTVVTTGRGDVEQRFGVSTSAPGEARRFVVRMLAAWGLDQFADDAALVVTELATNAVVHGRSDFAVALSARRGSVRIAVRDASDTAPMQRDATSTSSSGRGLALVDGVARRWGVEVQGGGKIVWADLGD